MRLSVALVTRNRSESLERTLRSLRAQDVQPFEVLISDDSDAEQTEVNRALAREYGARHVSGPHRGLYANRNASAVACEGTHVRTMDDDHEFPAGHMARCVEAIEERPGTIWIIGECLPGEEDSSRAWACPPQLGPRGFSVRPPQTGAIWAIADGAAIYPREIFDRGLRFSESFPFGAAYLEWGSRLHWLGYEIRHLPGTFIVHHLDLSARSFDDVRCDVGSRLFAALCHSFIYQPTPRNRLLTITQFGVFVKRSGPLALPAAVDGLRAYRRQRRATRALARAGS